MKNSFKIFTALIFLVLLGFLYSYYNTNNKNNISNDTAKVDYGKLNKIIFDVKTAKVIRGDLIKRINTNGIVRAQKEVNIVSRISGIIKKIYIYEGKHVKKGDLLIKLEDKDYQIALKEARDKLTSAEVELAFIKKFSPQVAKVNKYKAKKIQIKINKLKKNFEEGKISEKEFNKLKSELETQLVFTGIKRENMLLNKSGYNQAKNSFERAILNLSYTEIRAPFTGVVGDFHLSEGQLIASWTNLFKLFKTDTLKIDVGVLEDEIDKIHIGNSAEVTLPALNNEIFNAKVVEISPYIDSQTKTGKATLLILNGNKRIKPGMFAKVSIEAAELRNKILIPKQALLVRDNRTLVFTVEDSLAKWKYVKIGEQNNKYIEILSGVKAGEDVIIQGQFNLAHDSRVRVMNIK